MSRIGMHSFIDRQRNPNQGLTHWEISDAELIQRIEDNWSSHRHGYRDGVLVVPISPTGFKAGIRILEEGDPLVGHYTIRQQGERPRKTVYYESPLPVAQSKVEPLSVDVVLYHRNVLLADGEKAYFDWNVICILGKFIPSCENEPMSPDTLMANHFQDDGGTSTLMSAEQFEKALRESYFYWRDKALIGEK